MRAKFINEKFSEEGDPIEDMGIGTMVVDSNLNFLKKMAIPELEELYKRVHKQNTANVTVDGVPYNGLPVYSKTRLNNLTVKALNYKRNLIKRDEVRGQGLKPGDAIKCQIKGEWWIGYPEFSKRGIIKTDIHGRIVAKTLKGSMKVPLQYAIKLTSREQKKFDKEYFEKAKERLERNIAMYDWSPIRVKKYQEELEELKKQFKGKV